MAGRITGLSADILIYKHVATDGDEAWQNRLASVIASRPSLRVLRLTSVVTEEETIAAFEPGPRERWTKRPHSPR